jgi:hypothetical protein
LPPEIVPTTTAGIRPELFEKYPLYIPNKRLAAVVLALFIAIGFGLRVNQLGAESLGEDELNKLQTVAEYRTNGLSGKNGEHPFLMKGLQTLSISTFERLNLLTGSAISEEAALRFPIALFGSFTALLIFLLVSELFGRGIGLTAALFYTVEPAAIAFDRIAKEDSLVVFFFLLSMYLWVRGQTAAERGAKNWTWYAWGAGAAFAGLMASKYYPHLLAILAGYYIIFQYIDATKWRMEGVRWLKFLTVMGVAFLILNPTILLPDTWREMLKFSSENRIGHDSYEYLGGLYVNKMSAWLAGVPWTFYYVFLAVKTSLPILLLVPAGIAVALTRRLGDGRFALYIWGFMWFVPFTFLGGKFTRYFAFAEPLILILAAIGFCYLVGMLVERIAGTSKTAAVIHAGLLLAVLFVQMNNALSATPHYRLFTNSIGLAAGEPGRFFPHDEFYDAATCEIVEAIAAEARPGAVVANETPGLFEFYAAKAGRTDLRMVSLSDKSSIASLQADDFVVLAEGRRYFSNSAHVELLSGSQAGRVEIKLAGVVAARIYKLNEEQAAAVRQIAER